MSRKIKITLLAAAVLLAAGLLLFLGLQLRRGHDAPQQETLPDGTLDRPFTATATIRLDGATLVADLNRSAENAFTLQVQEPQALQGLAFSYDGDEILASYHGMEVAIGDDSLIARAMAGIVFRSIQEATAGSGLEISRSDGSLTIRGTGEDGEFSLQIDPERHTILELNVPALDLQCEFSDFLFQDGGALPEAS